LLIRRDVGERFVFLRMGLQSVGSGYWFQALMRLDGVGGRELRMRSSKIRRNMRVIQRYICEKFTKTEDIYITPNFISRDLVVRIN
jgi:hypothetical protein